MRATMETAWMKAHFAEAVDELAELIERLDSLSEVELEIALAHVYRHLNVGWNGRSDGTRADVSFPPEMSVYLVD